MRKALMIQGTGSGAGKSLIVTALCRIFSNRGLNVAPFKSQNMALNSFITADGGEIGRAQALQAEAARIEPTVNMNPILLKAQGESGCQVIIRGNVHGSMKAREYYAFRDQAWEAAMSAFETLSSKHEVLVIEGAGSPAEINLIDVDIVNMAVAKYARAPVLLVGDIERGGVFASLYGTMKLLGRDSRHIKGFIINKFRGDADILQPGLEMIGEKTATPVIGVLPYFDCTGLPEEDGMALSRIPARNPEAAKEVRIVIVRLQFISNFTDFDALKHEPDVEVIFSDNPTDIENCDMVIIPGTKNTVKDLLRIREKGLDRSIKRAHAKGIWIVGICGGYQMLGRLIYDPYSIESPHREVDGIGLLNIETSFEHVKTTCQVDAYIVGGDFPFSTSNTSTCLRGYEIHMGTSIGDIGIFRLRRIPDHGDTILDGSIKDNCWGTYIHGIFDNDWFRRAVINSLRADRNMPVIESNINYASTKNIAIERIAAMIEENIDMEFIDGLLKL